MPDRTARVAEAVRVTLSEAIAELNDPRIGFVTVTTVQIDREFSVARVFVSVLGSEQEQEQTLKALQSSVGILRREVGRAVKLRRVPQLRIEYDETLSTAMRINELLHESGQEDPR